MRYYPFIITLLFAIRKLHSTRLFGIHIFEEQAKWFNFSVYNLQFYSFDDMQNEIYKRGKYGIQKQMKQGYFAPDLYLDGMHIKLDDILSIKPRDIESSLLKRIFRLHKIKYREKIEFALRSDFRDRIWILESHTDPVFDAELDKVNPLYDLWDRWQWFLYFYYSHVIHRESFIHNQFLKEDNAEALSLVFIYNVCKVLRRKGINDHKCPNPCAASPCKGGKFLASENCELREFGLFEDDYKCDCLSGYLWSKYKLECVKDDLCVRHMHCSQRGTEKCFYMTSNDLFPTCYCTEAFMGRTCDQERNPCIERYDPSQLPGNILCNEGHRENLCLPLLGSDYFKCECGSSWFGSEEYSEPNCLQYRTRCESEVCVHGYCASAVDGKTGRCSCFPGYFGKHCEEKIPEWAKWNSWSQCLPICGNIRRKYRLRECNGKNCSGSSEQSEFCPSLSCEILNNKYNGFSFKRWKFSFQFYLLCTIFQITICSVFIVGLTFIMLKLSPL